MYRYVCACVYLNTCVYMCMYTYVYMLKHTCIYMYPCIYQSPHPQLDHFPITVNIAIITTTTIDRSSPSCDHFVTHMGGKLDSMIQTPGHCRRLNGTQPNEPGVKTPGFCRRLHTRPGRPDRHSVHALELSQGPHALPQGLDLCLQALHLVQDPLHILHLLLQHLHPLLQHLLLLLCHLRHGLSCGWRCLLCGRCLQRGHLAKRQWMPRRRDACCCCTGALKPWWGKWRK